MFDRIFSETRRILRQPGFPSSTSRLTRDAPARASLFATGYTCMANASVLPERPAKKARSLFSTRCQPAPVVWRLVIIDAKISLNGFFHGPPAAAVIGVTLIGKFLTATTTLISAGMTDENHPIQRVISHHNNSAAYAGVARKIPLTSA